jgi:5-methylthioribose kinase
MSDPNFWFGMSIGFMVGWFGAGLFWNYFIPSSHDRSQKHK